MTKVTWRCINDAWKYCASVPTNPLPYAATCESNPASCGNCITYTELNDRDGTTKYSKSRRPHFEGKHANSTT